jgi:hypothetical protein
MDAAKEVERAFAPIAAVVHEFALDNALRVDKCVRGNVGWELTRPHADGGAIFLLLLYDASRGLGVGSTWQFPCPEMSLLYSHFRPITSCPVDADAVEARLKSELEQLSTVRFGYWTHIRPLQTASEESA